MQNAGPDSPLHLLRPALAGLALTMLVAAAPAAAEDKRAPARPLGDSHRLAEAGSGNALPVEALPLEAPPRRRPRLWPTTIALGLGDADGSDEPTAVGLGYRMTEQLSVGAVGRVDPGSGEFMGVIALDFRF